MVSTTFISTVTTHVQVKEHPDKGVYVKDLSMQRVGNVEECERMMATGWENRSVGATLMNADSSRSHSIFTIYLEACDTGRYWLKVKQKLNKLAYDLI